MPLDDLPSEAPELTAAADDANAIVCARCGLMVTRASLRIEIDGHHEHTFINPYGHMFRIGCFREAEGAVAVSELSGEWTWFPGYTWQIVVCRGCGAHLGWRYARDDASFHGLSLDAVASR